MLENGSSATCSYEFHSAREGRLSLPPAFFTPMGERSDDATLRLEDGTTVTVTVTFGPVVGEAGFSVRD
jgi:hypothetical protein